MIEIKDNVKKNSKVKLGLCSTCNNQPSCLFYRGNGSRVAWYCELFDDYVSFSESLPQAKKKVESKTEETSKNKFEVLCKNCENQNTCAFPKPLGGIWHCEEYE